MEKLRLAEVKLCTQFTQIGVTGLAFNLRHTCLSSNFMHLLYYFLCFWGGNKVGAHGNYNTLMSYRNVKIHVM